MDYVAYILLALAVVSVWITGNARNLTWFLLVASSIAALVFKKVTIVGISSLIFTATIYWLWKNKTVGTLGKYSLGILFYALSYILFSHVMPGFNNLKALDQYQFSELSAPFTLYLNFDKPALGLIILLFSISVRKEVFLDGNYWKKTTLITLGAIISLLGPALALNYIVFDFKLDSNIILWGLNNLIFVCMAEEVLFRGLIQKDLEQKLQGRKYSNAIAIVMASLLFGFAHYRGGVEYIALSFIAGIFYGLAYQKTRGRIEASILVHFLVNLTHILFFTYPFINR